MTYQGKTITKHQRGNWFVRVRHNGKSVSIYGRTQLEAYAKLKALVDQIEIERAVALSQNFLQKIVSVKAVELIQEQKLVVKAVKTYTLKEWFDEWLNGYKADNVRVSTLHGFRTRFKHLHKLHDADICEITNLMLSKAINEVSAVRSKDGVHNLIKQMFAVAFNNRLIEVNPAASLPRPKQYAIHEKKAFTESQEKQFVSACMADLDKYAPLLVCLLQGLRKGEMLALRPNDFNFESDTLRIDESYDEQFPDDLQTKNQTSNRIMPMFSLTKRVLMRYANLDPKSRVFPCSSATLSKRLADLLGKIGLPRMTIHELRHTFISRCHEKKIDEIVVQRWVGHAIGSVMTKAVYTHIGNETEQRYIEILNT